MNVTEWPNRLGFDVDEFEVWKHRDAFGVRSDERCLRVPYSVTTDPQIAAMLCAEVGLLNDDLASMDPRDAQQVYMTTAPVQKELF